MSLQLTGRTRLRVLLIFVIVVSGLAILLWARGQRPHSNTATVNLNSESNTTDSVSKAAPVLAAPIQTPGVLKPNSDPLPGSDPTSGDPTHATSVVATVKLIIPVVGVKPDQLLDTFADARSEGRVHDAIDIPAPVGTPVVAAADGEIVRLFQSERGGTTIYQFSNDKKLVFYYAHLQRYADGLTAGHFARQGEVIGYVGDTGNAGAGNFHLHFSISIITDPKRHWEGTNINPYPLLRK